MAQRLNQSGHSQRIALLAQPIWTRAARRNRGAHGVGEDVEHCPWPTWRVK